MPLGYEIGHPDDARHIIKMEVINRNIPNQVRFGIIDMIPQNYKPSIDCSEKEMKFQLQLWRAFTLARKESNLGMYNSMVFEDRQMKVYIPRELLPINAPFDNIVLDMLEAIEHFKKTYAWPRKNPFGDSLPSFLPHTENRIHELESYDSETEQNIINLMED